MAWWAVMDPSNLLRTGKCWDSTDHSTMNPSWVRFIQILNRPQSPSSPRKGRFQALSWMSCMQLATGMGRMNKKRQTKAPRHSKKTKPNHKLLPLFITSFTRPLTPRASHLHWPHEWEGSFLPHPTLSVPFLSHTTHELSSLFSLFVSF